MQPDLTFDAPSHTYRYQGKVVPSVTQILEPLTDFSMVHPTTLDLAREFGTHVHAAVEMYVKGDLDEESLDKALRPYLDSWINFVEFSQIDVISSECRVLSLTPLYAGTADIIAKLNGRSCVIDIKSGAVPRTVGPQLAAYQHAHPMKPRDRYCLSLSPDKFTLIPCKDPRDFAVFQSCWNIWNWSHKPC